MLTAAATIALLVAERATPGAQAPSVDELVTAARSYLDTYVSKVSGVTLDEALMLAENSMTIRGTVPQRVSSDLILLNVAGELLGMRDVYAVDSKPVRPKEPRIALLLAEPTHAKWQTAQQYAREHAVYLRSNVVLWFSDPALVFRCLKATYHARLTFKIDGSKRVAITLMTMSRSVTIPMGTRSPLSSATITRSPTWC